MECGKWWLHVKNPHVKNPYAMHVVGCACVVSFVFCPPCVYLAIIMHVVVRRIKYLVFFSRLSVIYLSIPSVLISGCLDGPIHENG